MTEYLLEYPAGVVRIGSGAMEYIVLLNIIIIYRCFNAPLLSALSAERREQRLNVEERDTQLVIKTEELEIHLEHGRIGVAPSDEDGVGPAEFPELGAYLFERSAVQKIAVLLLGNFLNMVMKFLILCRADILGEDITLDELSVVIYIFDGTDLYDLACKRRNIKRICLAGERLVSLHIKNDKFASVSYLLAEHLFLPSRRPKTLSYYNRLLRSLRPEKQPSRP